MEQSEGRNVPIPAPNSSSSLLSSDVERGMVSNFVGIAMQSGSTEAETLTNKDIQRMKQNWRRIYLESLTCAHKESFITIICTDIGRSMIVSWRIVVNYRRHRTSVYLPAIELPEWTMELPRLILPFVANYFTACGALKKDNVQNSHQDSIVQEDTLHEPGWCDTWTQVSFRLGSLRLIIRIFERHSQTQTMARAGLNIKEEVISTFLAAQESDLIRCLQVRSMSCAHLLRKNWDFASCLWYPWLWKFCGNNTLTLVGQSGWGIIGARQCAWKIRRCRKWFWYPPSIDPCGTC